MCDRNGKYQDLKKGREKQGHFEEDYPRNEEMASEKPRSI